MASDPALEPPDAPPDLRLSLPAKRASVGLVRHVLTALVDDGSVGREELRPVLLAVSEAATNAVVHRPSAGTGRFAVCLWALPGRLLRITVHDDGGGPMVPPAVGEGSLGLGLPTIASVARAVELRRADGGGLELVMVFALAQSKLL